MTNASQHQPFTYPDYPADLAPIHADLIISGIPCHTGDGCIIVPMSEGRQLTITRDAEGRACMAWRCGMVDATMRCRDEAMAAEVAWLVQCDNDNGGE